MSTAGMLVAPVQPRPLEASADQSTLGRDLVAAIGMDLFADEGREDQVEGALGDPAVGPREAEIGQVDTPVERPQQLGEASPEGLHSPVVEVGQQPLGHDRQAAGRIQALDQGLEASGAAVPEDVEVGHTVAIAQRAHPRQRLALALRHRRQIGLDVGEPVAVALAEPPASRGHPAGHLDHLADAALDQIVEDRVDDPVAGEEQALEGRAAERLARGEGQAEGAMENTPLPGP
jgi:hypothetical protein